MWWRVCIALCVTALLAVLPARSQLIGEGIWKVPGGAACTAPSLDANANAAVEGNWASGTTFTLSPISSNASNVIVVVYVIWNGGVTVSSISDTVNTYTQRSVTAGALIAEWTAKASSALSALTLTVTFSSAPGFASAAAFVVDNANFASPFDPNGSLPLATNTTPPNSISTTNACTMVVSGARGGAATNTAGTGFTLVISNNFNAAEYAQFTSAQSGLSVGWGNNATVNGQIIDAITH